MKINILIPYKEMFDINKASSVSITVKNNLKYSKYLNYIEVFGKYTQKPLFRKNFVGIKYCFWSLQSRNRYLTSRMLKIITKRNDNNQIIEIHNRPYLVEHILNRTKKIPVTLFLHNDPKEMMGSKSTLERKKILDNCAGIFCVSQYIKNQFLSGICNDMQKVHVLYNGVNRRLKKFPIKKKEILFVGRIVPEKGVSLYVDVVSEIAKEFPEWKFGLIGSFKLGEIDKINTYASITIKKFNDIGSQAIFYGFKDHSFVNKKMEDASIVVIPSLWNEPFGLVAAEAMSNGSAIIASKVGGIPEIVKDNGLLIQNINSIKLKKALINLIKNEKLRLGLQKKSWKNFEFSATSSSKKLDNFRKQIFKDYF